jgi:hypothetical protein
MPDAIKKYVSFLNVPAGTQATLPHGLVMNGQPLAPDHLEFSGSDAPNFDWVSSDTVNLTVENNGTANGSMLVLAEAWHPIERSFGIQPDDGSLALHLTPRPFIVKSGSTSGGGGLTSVAHDATLTGNGTTLNPLGRSALTGDVTVAATSNASSISNGVVTNAKLATMPGSTLKGNDTGGATTPADLTATQAKALLAITPGDITGLAAIATSGSAGDLVAGTVPSSRMPGLTGDVNSSSGTVATTIANNVVTNAKLAQMPATTLKGNDTGGSSNPSDLTATQAKGLLAITPGDITGLAAIATSGSATDLVAGTVPSARMPALTGDVTSSAGSTATTIANGVVTNAKLAQMPATTLKGNSTGGSANPADLTATQAKTLLAITAGDVSGLAAIATSGSASDLVAGTVPAARMPALTGDVTSSAGSTATTIANNAVTNAKLAQMPATTLKGNSTGGAANAADLTSTQAKGLLAITAGDVSGLAAIATSGSASDLVAGTVPAGRMPALTGDVTSSAGSTATTIANSAVTNAKLANMPATTVKANVTGGSAAPTDTLISALSALIGVKLGLFSDGSDGAATMDGSTAVTGCTLASSTYTATRALFFTDLTVNNGVTLLPSGFPIYVMGTLTNNGDVNSNGNSASGATGGGATWVTGSANAYLPAGSGGSNASSGIGGNGGSSLNCPREFSSAAANGGAAGAVGTAGGAGHGGGGGGGGPVLGNAGGNGGTLSNLNAGLGDAHEREVAISGHSIGTAMGAGTGGGAGGGAGSGTGAGGGSGGGGGWMVIVAYAMAGSGTYRARGGNGAAGSSGNGGGGGGGGGGVVVISTGSTSPPVPDVTGGTAGAGSGTAAAGGKGGDGIAIVFKGP